MVEWGYKIGIKSRAIDLDVNDISIADELLEIVPALSTCIGCGSCTATCTAGALTNFNFRKLHTLIKRGEVLGAAEQADKCMLCGKCIIVCPRGINTRNVILTLKQLL